MAIGERIRFIRNLRGMTQKWLGQAVGFPPKTADVLSTSPVPEHRKRIW